jgi:hypothetical protein
MGSILSTSVQHHAHVSGNNNQVWIINGANYNISSMFDRIIGRIVNQTENIINKTEDIISTNNLVIMMNQMFILIILVLFISILHCMCSRYKPSAKTNVIDRLNTTAVPCTTFRI